jgi:hypothetical protein
MSGPDLLQLAAGTLVDAALGSTAVLGGALGTMGLLRRVTSASVRHALGMVAAAALVPLVGLAPSPASSWTFLLPVWGVGVVVVLGRRLRAELGLQRALRSGIAHSAFVEAPVPVPLTRGAFRPKIALPSGMPARLSPAELQAVLAHEQAHIARADWLSHLTLDLLCALFWFQPLAWWLRHRLHLLAECAVDGVVVASGHRPSLYATLLLQLGHAGPSVTAMSASAVGLRVRRVLTIERRDLRSWPGLVLGTLMTALAAPLWWRTEPVTPTPPMHCNPQSNRSAPLGMMCGLTE